MSTLKKGTFTENGWILCPSKTFPGKFYYFNVATGEAVWSNNEKQIVKKEIGPDIQKMNHRFHGYPEPTSPPAERFDVPPNTAWQNTSTSNQLPEHLSPTKTMMYQRPEHSMFHNTISIQNPEYPKCQNTALNQRPQHLMFQNTILNQRPEHSMFQNTILNQRPDNSMFQNAALTQIPEHSMFQNTTSNQRAEHSMFQNATSNQRAEHSMFQNTTSNQRSEHTMFQKTISNQKPDQKIFPNQNTTLSQWPDQNTLPIKTSPVSQWPEHKIPPFLNNNYFAQPWPEYKNSTFQNVNFIQQPQMFGQPATFMSNVGNFMPGMPNVGMPHVIWAPYQMPQPAWPCHTPEKRFARDPTSQMDRELFVHSSGVPLSHKFVNYNTPSEPAHQQNTINPSKFQQQLKNNNSKMESFENQVPMSKSIPERIVKKTSPDETVTKTSTMSPLNKVEFTNKHPRLGSSYKFKSRQALGSQFRNTNDLRFLLNAKRKSPGITQNKIKLKRPKFENYKTPQQKKVTFNLEKHNNSNSITTEEETQNYADINMPSESIPRSDNPDNTTKPKYNILRMIRTTPTELLNNSENKMSIKDNTIEARKIIQLKENPKSMSINYEKFKSMSINNGILKSMSKNYENLKSMSQNNSNNAEFDSIDSLSTEVVKALPSNHIIEPVVPNSTSMWYLVPDLDVLLDELPLIDGLLQADDKCTLLIPHCVRSEIEALCLGNYNGQHRVLVARQLSRRFIGEQKQCIVEPPWADNSNTIDAILNCCLRIMKNQHSVILFTNDPSLKLGANEFDIRCCSTQEIQNGALAKPKLFTELNKIKLVVDNTAFENGNVQFDADNYIPVNVYKKQLFKNIQQTDKNCDIMINITKPSISQNNESKVINSEFNNRVQLLTLKDAPITRHFNTQPVFLQNFSKSNIKSNENQLTNITNNNINHNHATNIFGFKKEVINTQKIVPKFAIPAQKQDQNKEILDPNLMQDNYFLSATDIVKTCHLTNNNKYYESQPENNKNKTPTIPNPTLENNTNVFNPKFSQKNISRQTDSKQNLNIPEKVHSKNETADTSTHAKHSATTYNLRSKFKNPKGMFEDAMKKFCAKNKTMHAKITNRMEEWSCTFTQIMEYFLTDILESNPDYVKQINRSYKDIHESLTCLKMMYEDENLTQILRAFLELWKISTCSKGKIKLDTCPMDFMRMVGCGVLLIQALQDILPDIQILVYYESLLATMVSNIESKAIDLDPELLRPTTVCRSEVDDTNNEERRNFAKAPSVIWEYLEKHYHLSKQNENTGIYNINPDGPPFKIIRMYGKNINKLTIDKNKTFSYNTLSKETSKKNETKMVKLLPKNQPNKDQKQHKPNKTNQSNINNVEKTNAESITIKNTENISHGNEFDEQGHTFAKFNDPTGPKMIRKMKAIDEYEEKIKTVEPLDLDVLDYSYDVSKKSEEFDSSDVRGEFNNFENAENYDFENDNSCFNKCNEVFIGHDQELLKNANKSYKKCVDNEKNKTLEKHLFLTNENKNYKFDENQNNYIEEGANNLDYFKTNSNNVCPDLSKAQTDGNKLVHMFLGELGEMFKIIYKFIIEFVKEFREDVLDEGKKPIVYTKANKFYDTICAVIQQLKNIMERESSMETDFKSLLFKDGGEDCTDPKITRYRQIIAKCLEQARVLQNALKIIICITIGDLDALSNNADSLSSSLKYFRI